MKYQLLGQSGLKVSELCLGTMTFGIEFGWGSTKRESRKVFDQFVEAGGNFFDTANYYTKGTSETYLGEFVRGKRDQYVIATKYTLNQRSGDLNAGGNHRKNLVHSLEASLKRLNTDYIDLYWVHAWDGTTPVEELMRALDDLVRAGKILYIGISNMPAWLIAKSNTLAELRNWTPFAAMQLQYNLAERNIEPEYFPLAKEFDMTITAWSPLAGGVLTGKYSQKKSQKSSSAFRYTVNDVWGKRLLIPRNFAIAEAVVQIAQESGHSPSQVALNWIRQKNSRVIPIFGAKNEEQLKDNLGCVGFKLTDDQMIRLDEVSKIPVGYPYEFLEREDIQKLVHGELVHAIENHRA